MAAAMICDRCKNYFKIEKVTRGQNVADYLTVGVRSNSGHCYNKSWFDICPKCREELDDWINKFNLPGEVIEAEEQDNG